MWGILTPQLCLSLSPHAFISHLLFSADLPSIFKVALDL